MQSTQNKTVPSFSWHTLSVAEALGKLETDTTHGLFGAEAAKRLEQFGPNEIAASGRTSGLKLLLSQFANIMVIILLVGIGLSLVLGHMTESIAIGVIVIFSVLLGFFQEFRAEKAIEALRSMAAPTATVLRDDEEMEIPAREVVPGDIIMLTAGNRIPADARIVNAVNLQTDEAALTGESLPVEKQGEALKDQMLAVGDRTNIIHAGTTVTYGRGSAVVIATGMQTEFGRIAGMLQNVERERTPLQKNLDRVGHALAIAALVIISFIIALGLTRGEPLVEMIIFGIALAVAVVPEALPAVVTISLAIGVQKMAKRHTLIRSLPAVETLGGTTVICTDKTGTLTKDEMTVRKIVIAGRTIDVSGAGYEPHGSFTEGDKTVETDASLKLLLGAGALCGDSHLIQHEGQWDIKGDPTEGAIVVAAAKAGLNKHDLDGHSPRSAEIPFTSESKRMTTLHKTAEGTIAYAKGAPEVIIDACTHVLTDKGNVPLSAQKREDMLNAAKNMAGDALRVIAVAMKEAQTIDKAETGMTLLGLFGMIDPPRPEAKEAIAQCRVAGIRVIMITGDHPVTAGAIARELGLSREVHVMTGAEFSAMDDHHATRAVIDTDVFARVSPDHKLQIVSTLQQLGHTVAMTGDGVNDAPALKKADIGVAMGITGTDVSKEAAAMMLTDDNFASIVAAVEEGRGIFSNIKKYLMYLLSSNIGEILLMLGATIMNLPIPLTAVQILYVNLVTDGFPALALAVDPKEQDLMKRAPRPRNRGIFTRPVTGLMLANGIWSAVVNLALFVWLQRAGASLQFSMTAVFALLMLIQFVKAYTFRSDRHSVFYRPFANKWLNHAVFWQIIPLIAMLHVPLLQRVFGTQPLDVRTWVTVIVLALSIIPVSEAVKWTVRRGWLGEAV